MKRVKVTQIRSRIDQPERQKRTLDALGLKKISQYREFDLTPQIEGMIKKVHHLVKVEEI